ncbi:MAG: MarR family transcriptional regulator [Pseudomonadota bacterium]
MVQAHGTLTDFSYDTARDAAGLPARVTIFADDERLRSEIGEDLLGAGFRSVDGGQVVDLIEGPITSLGDVVMIDCFAGSGGGLDARSLAALSRLDMRIAQSGAQLIVSTSFEALDDVFATLDQSQAQILVKPSRADRVVAVGRVLTGVSNGRVREMSENDRMTLLRLSEQVDSIAQELDRISSFGSDAPSGADDFSREYSAASGGSIALLDVNKPSARPALPDPRDVRQMIAARHARARFFDAELFADPAWDMMLDLVAAHGEKARVSVTSLCIAAGVPATTALRWLKQMVESGIFVRVADPDDRRRAFIELSETSLDAMARYFSAIDIPLAKAA